MIDAAAERAIIGDFLDLMESCTDFLERRGWKQIEVRIVGDESLGTSAWSKGDPRCGGRICIGIRNALDAELGSKW